MKRLQFCLTVVAVLALTVSAFAQVQFGQFTGTVTDPTGAAIANAKVTVNNPVTDLNLMMRRGRFDCRFERRLASAPLRLTPRSGTRVIVALSELIVRCAAEEADLARLDALLIEGESRCEVIAQAPAASFYLIEIFARP